jgi:glycosyltransferase involved in cell wall biosynthesis
MLADALVQLTADPAERERLGAAAAESARARFGIDKHVAEIAALYRQGLAERSGRTALIGARG